MHFAAATARRPHQSRGEQRYGDIGRAEVRRRSVLQALSMLSELAVDEPTEQLGRHDTLELCTTAAGDIIQHAFAVSDREPKRDRRNLDPACGRKPAVRTTLESYGEARNAASNMAPISSPSRTTAEFVVDEELDLACPFARRSKAPAVR